MTTKIALIQISCSADKNENIRRAGRLISDAAGAGAKIICLPELFYSTYFPQYMKMEFFDLAEPVPGPTTKILADLAKDEGVFLIVPVFEQEAGRIHYNTAVMINPGGEIIGKYRKNHIPHNDGYQEKYYFRPGDLGYPVFATPYGNIAVSICWDHWFLEVQRIYSLKGADIIFSPTALGLCDFPGSHIDKKYLERWEMMLRGQAVQNGVFMAVNMRTGIEDKITFCGGSFVANPKGDVIAKLGDEEGILLADIDIGLVRRWHNHQQYFRDRRVDTYQDLIK